MRTLRTIKLDRTDRIYHDVYSDEGVIWAAVKKGQLLGYNTSCKEEIGSTAVQHKTYEFVVVCHERLDEIEVVKLEEKLNKEHKELGVAGLKFSRVDGKRKWLYCKHSDRWSRNSVAHSYLTTMIRKGIMDVTEVGCWDDKEHLQDAKCVVDIIKAKGLRVFGTKQHSGYDVGMVSLASRLNDGVLGTRKDSETPKPEREDYDSDWDWEDAVDDWEYDELTDYDGGGRGDLDSPIPADNAYQRLIDIFNGVKK